MDIPRALSIGLMIILAAIGPGVSVSSVYNSEFLEQRRTIEADIKSDNIARYVDNRLEYAGHYFLDAARAANCSRKNYNAWVLAVGSALRSESSPPSEGSIVLSYAQRDIEPFRTPYPATGHDLATAMALRESSQLPSIGRNLTYVFRGQPAEVRDAAANYFERQYSIHRSASECSLLNDLLNRQ